jgi:hypothetical protein
MDENFEILLNDSSIEYELVPKETFSLRFSLASHFFLQLVLSNDKWREEFFRLAKDINALLSIDESHLNVQSSDNNELCERDWNDRVNNFLDSYIKQFYVEEIIYDLSNFNSIVELLKQIDAFKCNYPILYHYQILIPKVLILGRRLDVMSFFRCNDHLKHLSKLGPIIDLENENENGNRKTKRKVVSGRENYEKSIKRYRPNKF